MAWLIKKKVESGPVCSMYCVELAALEIVFVLGRFGIKV